MTLISDFQQKAQRLIPEQKEFLIQQIQRISKEQKIIQENKEYPHQTGREVPKNFGAAALKEPMEDFVVTCYLMFDSPDKEKYTSKWGGYLATASSLLAYKLVEARKISYLLSCDLFTAVGYFRSQDCSGFNRISKTNETMPPEKVKGYMDIIETYAGLSRKGQEKFIQNIQKQTGEKVCSYKLKPHNVSPLRTR